MSGNPFHQASRMWATEIWAPTSRRTRLRYWWRRTWPRIICGLLGHVWEIGCGQTTAWDWCPLCDQEREKRA